VKLWLDAQLSPQLARWLFERFRLEATCVRDVGLRDSEDEAIFFAAREANAVVVTKDHDFVLLLDRFGPPPSVLWITCGNTSNASIGRPQARRPCGSGRVPRSGNPVV
jgi:predicted nuclease of predicted toxin-antitoxin system